jgi:ribosomal protein L7/L12
MLGQSQELPAAAIEALTKGHKIEAIKILRQETDLSLKQAKDAVDMYLGSRPELASQIQRSSAPDKRLKLWLVVLFVAIFLLYKFLRS